MKARSAGCMGLASTATSTCPAARRGASTAPKASTSAGSPAFSNRTASMGNLLAEEETVFPILRTENVRNSTMSVQKSPELAQLDWDGLRYFLAVAQAGTVSGAAREPRVEHTTIARRIDALERELGATLFLRIPRGDVPTSLVEALVEAAESINVE